MSKDLEKISNLYNSIAEDILELSDKELMDELDTNFNSSIASEAESIRSIFANSLKDFQSSNRTKAVNQSSKTTFLDQEIISILSKSVQEKVNYIEEVIQLCSNFGFPKPTLQFRDLKTISDEDATLIIKSFVSTGLIQKIKKAKNEKA